ncbi:MAG: class I SAM-dependent methyltransferase [Reyranellaceae bacterium]
MWNDVVDLRDFYGQSLGQVAQRLIRNRLRSMWPSLRGQSLLGLGYATPYLRPFMDEAERVIAVMPAAQGVLRWPQNESSLVALADETALPLPDRSMDRVLLVHALECSEQIRPMLREAWRVLADGGRLLVIAPNRTGLWAQLERSPFAVGHPYSAGQLGRLLRATMFTPMQEARALYVPPVRSRMVLRAAPALERLGQRLLPRFAGVVMLEAGKQLYAGTALREPAKAPVRAKLRVVPQPAARNPVDDGKPSFD